MLFNSFPFLFGFLPIAYLGVVLLVWRDRVHAIVSWLVLCSLFFYGYWNYAFLPVIVVSILANYLIGNAILVRPADRTARMILTIGIALNLGALIYFKYTGLLTDLVTSPDTATFFTTVVAVSLPIGISFYTFQQIAFLADCYWGRARGKRPFVDYAFFVTFFPQLIAGPIVHHAEIMPQLARIADRMRGPRYVPQYVVPGLALLIIGLAKKTILADTFGNYADPAFLAANTSRLTFVDAWGGAVAYTLQIYFDFSAYSDMAIGLGLFFGLVLPINFLSPYQATSIIDFWRRWHITLSRFLRDYLYIPLGGNRCSPARRYLNLMITMALGGLWHGANLTFLVWGLLHGLLLILNHAFRALVGWRIPAWLGIAVTFPILVLTWVPFRANSLASMAHYYAVMFGADGIVVPARYRDFVTGLGPTADAIGLRVGNLQLFGGTQQALVTAIGLAIVFFTPRGIDLLRERTRRRYLNGHAAPVFLGSALTVALILIWARDVVQFLYFQF